MACLQLNAHVRAVQIKEAAERGKSAVDFARSLEQSLQEAHTRCVAAEEAAAHANRDAESASATVGQLQEEVRFCFCCGGCAVGPRILVGLFLYYFLASPTILCFCFGGCARYLLVRV